MLFYEFKNHRRTWIIVIKTINIRFTHYDVYTFRVDHIEDRTKNRTFVCYLRNVQVI